MSFTQAGQNLVAESRNYKVTFTKGQVINYSVTPGIFLISLWSAKPQVGVYRCTQLLMPISEVHKLLSAVLAEDSPLRSHLLWITATRLQSEGAPSWAVPKQIQQAGEWVINYVFEYNPRVIWEHPGFKAPRSGYSLSDDSMLLLPLPK